MMSRNECVAIRGSMAAGLRLVCATRHMATNAQHDPKPESCCCTEHSLGARKWKTRNPKCRQRWRFALFRFA